MVRLYIVPQKTYVGVGELLLDHVNPGCGGYTGLAVQQVQQKEVKRRVIDNNEVVVNTNADDAPTTETENIRAYQDEEDVMMMLYASTITGGLYALRLEHAGEHQALNGNSDDDAASGLRLRCTGFVEGNAIL